MLREPALLPALAWRADGSALLSIATDVAAGLAYLHENQSAHGALCVTNVVLTAEWHAKLTECAHDHPSPPSALLLTARGISVPAPCATRVISRPPFPFHRYSMNQLLLDGGGAHGGGLGWLRHAGPSGTPAGRNTACVPAPRPPPHQPT